MLSNFLFYKPKNVGNAKCRPTIDRVSTNYWPIHRSSIDQLSAKCRQSVDEVSVNEKLYRPRHIWNDYRLCLDRVSTHYRPLYRPTVDRVSTEYRPSVDQLSTHCRPSVERLSTECWLLYRPISRSTLPIVNKIQVICYTGFTYSIGFTNCSIVWNFFHCIYFHCAYLIKRKILTMIGLGLSENTKINSHQEKPISPNCKICSCKTQKSQTSANISC